MKIKQYYPFIVPTISLLLVLFLAFRWYNLRTQRDFVNDVAQVEIENLTQDELLIVQGTQDVSTVDLESETEEPASGQIRYKIEDDRVLLTVNAELEEVEGVDYQVWLVSEEKQPQRGFSLEKTKAGYLGSASIRLEQLPIEVIVTDQSGVSEDEMGREILRGIVEAFEESEE